MAPLRIPVDQSPLLERILIGLHVVACGSILVSGLDWPLQAVLTALLLVHFGMHRWRRVTTAGGCQALTYSEMDGWRFLEEGRAPEALKLLPSTFVSPWLVIVHALTGERFRAWVVVRDSVDRDSYRRLRVALRLGPQSGRQSQSSFHPVP